MDINLSILNFLNFIYIRRRVWVPKPMATLGRVRGRGPQEFLEKAKPSQKRLLGGAGAKRRRFGNPYPPQNK
jgi:hypothetical protein